MVAEEEDATTATNMAPHSTARLVRSSSLKWYRTPANDTKPAVADSTGSVGKIDHGVASSRVFAADPEINCCALTGWRGRF